ncbi:MAG TPA: hypothetical protein VLN58_12125, partial [Verrucomicrobiae bacterium]|nr:hypothetical protein [Verrucomicrobiae bacterium]
VHRIACFQFVLLGKQLPAAESRAERPEVGICLPKYQLPSTNYLSQIVNEHSPSALGRGNLDSAGLVPGRHRPKSTHVSMLIEANQLRKGTMSFLPIANLRVPHPSPKLAVVFSASEEG